ncbi:MAG TPA: hypothetical protein EYO58_11805 [Flavobacteriales bacterium]|nr:hypothetical protein [Flavobacteriales bacterium]
MPIENITFEYIKWRPKLCTQLQHLAQYITHSIVMNVVSNRIQILRLVISEFQQREWRWSPTGTEDLCTSNDNELHDIPMQWQQAYQIEDMQKTIQQMKTQITHLQSKLKVLPETPVSTLISSEPQSIMSSSTTPQYLHFA